MSLRSQTWSAYFWFSNLVQDSQMVILWAVVRKFATEHRTSFWQRFCLRRFFRVRFWRGPFRPVKLLWSDALLVSFHQFPQTQMRKISNIHIHIYQQQTLANTNIPIRKKPWKIHQTLITKRIFRSIQPRHLGRVLPLAPRRVATSCPVTKQVLVWGNHIHPFSGDWRGIVGWCVSWNGNIAIVSMSFRRWIMPWNLVWEQHHFCTTQPGNATNGKGLRSYTLKLRYRWIRSQNHKLWPFKPSWNCWN